jgi:hypothetical protein
VIQFSRYGGTTVSAKARCTTSSNRTNDALRRYFANPVIPCICYIKVAQVVSYHAGRILKGSIESRAAVSTEPCSSSSRSEAAAVADERRPQARHGRDEVTAGLRRKDRTMGKDIAGAKQGPRGMKCRTKSPRQGSLLGCMRDSAHATSNPCQSENGIVLCFVEESSNRRWIVDSFLGRVVIAVILQIRTVEYVGRVHVQDSVDANKG